MKNKNKRKIERLNKQIAELKSDLKTMIYGQEHEKLIVKMRYDISVKIDNLIWNGDYNN
jgi:hypothetical protein